MSGGRILSRIRRLLPAPTPTTLRSQEAYALWAESYPPYAHNDLMQIEQAAMLRLIPDLKGRAVLDLACGTGRYGKIAVGAGASRVVGTDNSAPMLHEGERTAGSSAPAQKFSPVLASMKHLPFAVACFDVILCGLATGHLPPAAMRECIAEMGRVLRPGGEALFSDFHPALYAQGGRRTFTAPGGKRYAVEHYPHTLADYTEAISRAGMAVTGVEEPEAEVSGKRRAAVLVIRCQRTG